MRIERHEKTAEWARDFEQAWLAALRGEHRELSSVSFSDAVPLLLKKHVPANTTPLELLSHAVSDFPAVLENIGSKRVLEHMRSLTPPHRRVTREIELPDFKPSATVTAQAPPLLPIAPGGEIRWGRVEEAGEPVALTAYGRAWGLSRQAIVNDDKAAFDAAMRQVAEQVVIAEAKLVWGFIQTSSGSGPTMADGFPFFDAVNHANETGAAALDESSIAAAMELLRTQVDLQAEPLNLEPRVLACKPADELAARKAVEAMGLRSALAVVPEARIDSATSFYVLADPEVHPSFVRARLMESGPRVFAQPSFELDSMEFKITVDLGAGAHSWRGAVRVPAP